MNETGGTLLFKKKGIIQVQSDCNSNLPKFLKASIPVSYP
jgi:hypothetical protein